MVLLPSPKMCVVCLVATLLAASASWAGAGQDAQEELKKARAEIAALKLQLEEARKANEQEKRKEALDWGVGVGTDFVASLHKKQYGVAAALLSPDLKKAIAPVKGVEGKDQSYDKQDLDQALVKVRTRWETVGVNPANAKVSPDCTEVFMVVGEFNGSIRVAREGDTKGRWRVIFFRTQ